MTNSAPSAVSAVSTVSAVSAVSATSLSLARSALVDGGSSDELECSSLGLPSPPGARGSRSAAPRAQGCGSRGAAATWGTVWCAATGGTGGGCTAGRGGRACRVPRIPCCPARASLEPEEAASRSASRSLSHDDAPSPPRSTGPHGTAGARQHLAGAPRASCALGDSRSSSAIMNAAVERMPVPEIGRPACGAARSGRGSAWQRWVRELQRPAGWSAGSHVRAHHPSCS